ncbi:hypothetical protein [Halorussus sp. MSC15.2]|uniref:DUF7331 family protein n=1 Tax=Halorussus sp. MSC15.2 TaxID=2283638 RepID=UPI0019678572|nr:hypothetical protein [Halorussus sp. MSC15.2]
MDETQTHTVETARTEPDRTDFDDYASYEENDSLVVCDRQNPNAWVKSDVTAEIRS